MIHGALPCHDGASSFGTEDIRQLADLTVGTWASPNFREGSCSVANSRHVRHGLRAIPEQGQRLRADVFSSGFSATVSGVAVGSRGSLFLAIVMVQSRARRRIVNLFDRLGLITGGQACKQRQPDTPSQPGESRTVQSD